MLGGLRLRRARSSCESLSTFAVGFQPSTPSDLPPDANLKLLCLDGRLSEALWEMAVLATEVMFRGYDALVTECVNRRALTEGRRVHAHMIKTSYRPPVYLDTRLLIMYDKCGVLADAREVFDGMPQRNVVSWTAMISAYSQRGYQSEALGLFRWMLRTGVPPNQFTLATVLASCTGPQGLEHGREVHSLAIKNNYESHVYVGSSLLNMYAKASEIQDARKVFDMLPDRDVVSCTSIISGYAQLGHDEEALEVFQKLYKQGMECNYVTFVSLLTSLAGLSALDYGKQVHGLVIRQQVPFYVILQNTLIYMYGRCGSLSYSRRVFESMPERTVISWNAMLVGYGNHGLGREVIALFKSMRNVKPDHVTYTAVLSGCSHGGLADEGLKIFNSMVTEKVMQPEIGHYACVVDLLGRAGKIEKALEFIKGMPLEPTTAMWGSLLGACRVHGNISAGEYTAQRLLCIEPENAGNYVILSNIYADAGRWENVIRVRELMKEKTIMKEPGRSWIYLNKIVHTFHSSDRTHPQRDEVHAKVRDLYEKIKEAGYAPNLSCVLHDVDDEQKERILLGHSEKLAIAFGIMSGPQDGILRVTKNLRICVDCHNFAKLVSLVSGREISVRDSKRFHLFANGECSCGDFW
ncbi:Putative pentatricopeptide repeat-containing protein [Apostasia shenzhenica]|uniref:Pentatricopeptide repeat-containing protein n=1 Tax=Apostasia shenzhenica TaxID=1088818 RepID=A0A2I0ABB0_9ASPA|nr:Putative pentatricopeptide repeat-containing protein [Apostasia shenzhenica]